MSRSESVARSVNTPRERQSITWRSSAGLLLLGELPLSFDAATLAGSRRLGGLTRFGTMEHGQDHFAELLQTIVDIASLVAITLAGDEQVTAFGQPRAVTLDKPSSHVFWQAGAHLNRPAQQRLAVYLVHVLTAGTGAARKGEFKLLTRNLDAGIYAKHGSTLSGPAVTFLHQFIIVSQFPHVGFAMAHILLTSGPTRQYLDPVRYLTNGSSGRMGKALAEAALEQGHDVTIVSGPVEVAYPAAAHVVPVVSTEEMLDKCQELFAACDGLIGVAAPCDYRPVRVEESKIAKTGQPLVLHLIETPDVVATLGAAKTHQWVVGFALETQDQRLRALAKLEKKSCDLMVLNGPEAMHSPDNRVEILDRTGAIVATLAGPKDAVARGIFTIIQARLIAQAG